MNILVLDPEPKWRELWESRGADTAGALEGALALIDSRPRYDKVILSSRLMYCIPALLQAGLRVEVATASPTTTESAEAYRVGASDYYTKSF